MLTLKTAQLFKFLRPILNSRHHKKDAKLLSLELTRMTWCLAYYLGFHEKNGGPPFEIIRDDLFDCETVGEAWQSVPPPITVAE